MLKHDWRQELRSRVRNDQEEAERRLARVDSPSWRMRLEAVKAQMEESSQKVELAEQEMRRAVASIREEQRGLSNQQTGSVRQQSFQEMQRLLHGLRNEQQGTQSSLHVSQISLRRARIHTIGHVLLSGLLVRLGRALALWARVSYAVIALWQKHACTEGDLIT